MNLIQATRRNIGSLLGQCNVPYKVFPFDEELYQECMDDAKRRGYPVDGDKSTLTFLREGVTYASLPGMHLPHRPTQIWIGLYTALTIFVDETAARFPEELPNIYLFNDRFIRNEPQGNDVLNALADVLHRTSDLYRPVASHLIVTATQNFFAACLLEYETKSMKISSAAERYPSFQRTLSGIAEAYAFFAFPREVLLNDYIQAIPDLTLFIHNVNDVLSFYKEELEGEMTNQVSTLASRANKSKLEAFAELTEETIGLYGTILKILEGSSEACEAFRQFTAGYAYYHISTPRYRFEDLGL